MKKRLAILLSTTLAAGILTAGAITASAEDYSDYTIRIYSNSNSTERTTWLIHEAEDAGCSISIQGMIDVIAKAADNAMAAAADLAAAA